MSCHIYRISAPGNELDGETFDLLDSNPDRADERAAARVKETFSWSLRTDSRAVYVTSYASREAMRKAEAAAESGVALVGPQRRTVAR